MHMIADNYRKDGSCTQCEAVMINGVYCHETGCPVAKRENIDNECFECGTQIVDGKCKHCEENEQEFYDETW